MKYLRVIDEAGNNTDYETEFVPRIGERIVLHYKVGNDLLKHHYFRVKDVMYKLDNAPDAQVAVLIAEDHDPQPWPD